MPNSMAKTFCGLTIIAGSIAEPSFDVECSPQFTASRPPFLYFCFSVAQSFRLHVTGINCEQENTYTDHKRMHLLGTLNARGKSDMHTLMQFILDFGLAENGGLFWRIRQNFLTHRPSPGLGGGAESTGTDLRLCFPFDRLGKRVSSTSAGHGCILCFLAGVLHIVDGHGFNENTSLLAYRKFFLHKTITALNLC